MSWCSSTMYGACGLLLIAACDRTPKDQAVDVAIVPDSAEVAPPLPDFSGEWRVARAIRAPWVMDSAVQPNAQELVGRAVTFGGSTIDGPGVLTCTNVDHTFVELPAEGLFEGGLQDASTTGAQDTSVSSAASSRSTLSAASLAAQLGIDLLPARAVRLTCSTGGFDFVRLDSLSMLVALDNQIVTLVRMPPAVPEATAVQALLEAHFAGDMAFDRTRTSQKRAMLSPTLWLDMQAYFARPVPADEPPAINGDPFTNAQEYPTRFAVTDVQAEGAMSRVRVVFRDAYRVTNVWYVMERINNEWLLHDIEYDDATTLRSLLKS